MGYYDSDRDRLRRLIDQTTEESLKERIEQIRAENPKTPGLPDLTCPIFAGSLRHFVQEFRRLAQLLDAELEQVKRHDQAMQWAAEYTLTDRVEGGTHRSSERWEVFYEAVEIVEKALKGGMSLERLRGYLKDGITEQEYAQKRLLDDDEVCAWCEEYVGKEGTCTTCNGG